MASFSSAEGKPLLDEATFQKLLAAAYVLQEHRRQPEVAPSAVSQTNHGDADYAQTLAEIVETQHQILLRHLDLDGAAGLVAEQTQKITSASGAAICLLSHNHLVYRAVSGVAAADMGQALPRDRSLSVQTLAHGIVVRCADVLTEIQIETALAKRAGISSFVSVPIFHDDRIAGALELSYAKPAGFEERDVRTCQLMAGLMTEVLTRISDSQWKKDLTAERDSMLEALEKLKPQLDRLAKEAEALSASATPTRVRSSIPSSLSTPSESVLKPILPKIPDTGKVPRAAGEVCTRCGHEIAPQEVYCGNCGTLRPRGAASPARQPSTEEAVRSNLSRESASPPFPRMNESSRPSFSSNLVDPDLQLPSEVLALTKQEIEEEPDHDIGAALLKLLPPDPDAPEPEPEPSLETQPARIVEAPTASDAALEVTPSPAPEYPWTSAANARAWLNSLSNAEGRAGLAGFLKMHRGDLSLGTAIVALLITLLWGMSSHKPAPAHSPPAPATTTSDSADTGASAATRQSQAKAPDPQPELSWGERALVALGLAEAPTPQQQYEGNPNVKVWVDLRTALYYCPSADLYGKTEGGQYMTQRQAQIDQFEPALRRVCE
jgi:putative methionine-R-sulfoxide reductase with GAF domain